MDYGQSQQFLAYYKAIGNQKNQNESSRQNPKEKNQASDIHLKDPGSVT